MDKYTVVIPTIWKSEYTYELLKRLSDSEYVGEIILIDNASELNKEINIQKVIHIKEQENTYVNPAWNKGVNLASHNNITIVNDDIIFDVDEYYSYFAQLLEINEFKNIGFIGSHSENYKLEKSQNPSFEEYDNKTNTGGWGCLFSFHKSNWKPIPNELKIWYGDNWIHLVSNPILHLRGIKIETKMSTSSDLEEMNPIKENDTRIWHRMLNII